MSEVYVVRNQLGHFWGKSKAWVDGSDRRALQRLKHEDEAINLLFELSSKDVELRGQVVAAQLDAKGEPEVEVSANPLPQLEDEASEEPVEATTA